MWVTKLLISQVKIRIFCPTTKFGPKLAFLFILGQALLAHLMAWLVVVARGLYLARHLFTLFHGFRTSELIKSHSILENGQIRPSNIDLCFH